jgi:hypothetical protein
MRPVTLPLQDSSTVCGPDSDAEYVHQDTQLAFHNQDVDSATELLFELLFDDNDDHAGREPPSVSSRLPW